MFRECVGKAIAEVEARRVPALSEAAKCFPGNGRLYSIERSHLELEAFEEIIENGRTFRTAANGENNLQLKQGWSGDQSPSISMNPG